MKPKTAKIKTVGLIGYGKLARHLAPALAGSGIIINQWCIRNKSDHQEILDKYSVSAVTQVDDIIDSSDLILIMVNDQAISEVGLQLKNTRAIVCHTSGMTSVDELPQKRAGIFYPLNTFNGINTTWNNDTPIFIHTKDSDHVAILSDLAQRLSNQVQVISPKDLQVVHLAAVISQNFSNHLIAHGEALLEAHQLDRSLIHPLLQTMVENLNLAPARLNQTGPAQRRDQTTTAHQSAILEQSPDLLSLYEALTKDIQKHH